jgi:hypothetical protein
VATNNTAIDYQIYPRLLAEAEVAWSAQQNRSWPDFSRRLAAHLARLDELGIEYFAPAGDAAKLGRWAASDFAPHAERRFAWDATSVFRTEGKYRVEVRRDTQGSRILVKSVCLLEDGKEINCDRYASGVGIDFKISWFTLTRLKTGARYTIQVIFESEKAVSAQGTVWVAPPRLSANYHPS